MSAVGTRPASQVQAQLQPRSLSITSAKLAGPITKVDGTVKKYVFDVEFNRGGKAPGLKGRVEQIEVESDSMHNALKALHTVGKHAAALDDTKYHQMITKLKAGCTKFDFQEGKKGTEAHCHDWNAHKSSFDMESRSSITFTQQQMREIDMLVDMNGGDATPADGLDVSMDPHAHIDMTRSHAQVGTGVRVHTSRGGTEASKKVPIVAGAPNPRARHKKGSATHITRIARMAKDDKYIAFYRGDLGKKFDASTGNDPRTDVFGNFYETAVAFEVECSYYDPIQGLEVKTKRAFTNTEAYFQSQRFKSLEAQEMFVGLTGQKAIELSKDLQSGDVTLKDGSKAEQFGDWSSQRASGKHMENRNSCVMKRALEAKFAKGTEEAKALLATGDARLVEHNCSSSRDKLWSDGGSDQDGKNFLGLFLEIRRTHLKADKAVADHTEYGVLPDQFKVTRYNPK
ncbi:MAG: hypothetical protein S4CHLAM37_11780 [Chlamydiia bacterium]|nr:hypothetical protein [Chlamydiia bacterium]